MTLVPQGLISCRMGSLKNPLQLIFNIGVNFMGKCIGYPMCVCVCLCVCVFLFICTTLVA